MLTEDTVSHSLEMCQPRDCGHLARANQTAMCGPLGWRMRSLVGQGLQTVDTGLHCSNTTNFPCEAEIQMAAELAVGFP